jgi:hypothetical protein
MQSVAQAAGLQAVAAVKLIAWVSRGTMSPSKNDFGMLRLMLMVFLPQAAGLGLPP